MLKFISFAVLIALIATSQAIAAGGTRDVAWKGRRVDVSPSWPQGVAEVLNDPTRTDGWNPWFTGYPNDVNHYAFEVETMDDLNRIITKLAACRCKVREIKLSHEQEPTSLGFVSGLPKGNKYVCLFSIGDQAWIDRFYSAAGPPFPIALPPTLTIYVQNEIVDLDELEIPMSINVSAGSAVVIGKAVDAPSQSTVERIDSFLRARAETSGRTKR